MSELRRGKGTGQGLASARSHPAPAALAPCRGDLAATPLWPRTHLADVDDCWRRRSSCAHSWGWTSTTGYAGIHGTMKPRRQSMHTHAYHWTTSDVM